MKVKLDPGAYMPKRAHEYDAGLDLRSMICQTIPARGSAVFDTGVHIQLPHSTFGDIRPKSGLNFKHDVVCEKQRISEVMMTDGTIDETYTGSIKVKLYNLGDTDYNVERGDKICQLVIIPALYVVPERVDELEETDRGDNGFGSTGK